MASDDRKRKPKRLLSVVICVYNRADLVAQCIESVLQQSDPDVNIIVVNDGSNDGTLHALNRFADKITVISQENRGPGAARNAGIQLAESEYVAFLDSDDEWYPWTVETYKHVLKDNGYPDCLASLGRENGKLPRTGRSLDQSKQLRSMYFASPCEAIPANNAEPWYPSGFVARRSRLLAASGFYPKKVNCEDVDLWYRLGNCEGMVFLQNPPTFLRRVHTNQLTWDMDKSFRGCMLICGREIAGRYPMAHLRSYRIEQIAFICKFYAEKLLQRFAIGRVTLLVVITILLIATSPGAQRAFGRRLMKRVAKNLRPGVAT